MSRYDYWGGYSPSTPIEVEGGIKAKSRRGAIGDTWWSKKWVELLESFGWKSRLDRGKRYARKGQVLNYTIKDNTISAQTQGSRPTPYNVTITIQPFDNKTWDQIIESLASKASYAAKLLNGEMPHDIEDVLQDITLFPQSPREIKTKCSCPDSANPCKHIAAVYYIIAEEFDRDPFIIFALRGKDREQIIAALREHRLESCPERTEPEVLEPVEEKDFWKGNELTFPVEIGTPQGNAALIKNLGTPQFWDSRNDFDKLMEKYYTSISDTAISLAYGQPLSPEPLKLGKDHCDINGIYQLKISLQDVKPPIWRQIHVRDDITLDQLHRIIQTLMEWKDKKDHRFNTPAKKGTKLSELIKDEGDILEYTYDTYQARWELSILLEKTLLPDPDQIYPVCLRGRRASPPEDCGGAVIYSKIVAILGSRDLDLDYIADLWKGGIPIGHEPKRFDKQRLNKTLQE